MEPTQDHVVRETIDADVVAALLYVLLTDAVPANTIAEAVTKATRLVGQNRTLKPGDPNLEAWARAQAKRLR